MEAHHPMADDIDPNIPLIALAQFLHEAGEGYLSNLMGQAHGR